MITITGSSLHVPSLGPETRLLGWSPGPACPPEDARELLGRKGLLAKEQATILALCAVHRALELAPGTGPHRRGDQVDAGTAVVVSSNLGNLATVCAVTRTAYAGRLREVSPLDAPNVSSNVIASSVAIRFGFGGPNLMVCSGETSGADALAMAARLIRSGRCRRSVVIGVEPRDHVAEAVYSSDDRAKQLFDGAACVVLEQAEGEIVLGPITAGMRLEPNHAEAVLASPRAVTEYGGLDLDEPLGATYGARGVVQAAVARQAVASGVATSVRVIDGGRAGGYRLFSVRREPPG